MADPITIAQAKRASEDASYMKKTVESPFYSEVTPDGVDKRTISGMNTDVDNLITTYTDSLDASITASEGFAITSEEQALLSQGYKNESETARDEAQGYATQSGISATEAKDSASQSLANANFKGVWVGSTGVSNIPATWYHSGGVWQQLLDLTEIQLSEPSQTNTDYLLVTEKTVFDSIEDMKANLIFYVGQKVSTLGYYEKGDGGGHDYVVRARVGGYGQNNSVIIPIYFDEYQAFPLDSALDGSHAGILPSVASEDNTKRFNDLAGQAFSRGQKLVSITQDAEYLCTGELNKVYHVTFVGQGKIIGNVKNNHYKRIYPTESLGTQVTMNNSNGNQLANFIASINDYKAGGDIPNVVIIGDSLVQGAHREQDNYWFVKDLERKLRDTFSEINFYNRGIAGSAVKQIDQVVQNTTDISAPYETPWNVDTGKLLRDYVSELNPNLIIIAYGMNSGSSGEGTQDVINARANLKLVCPDADIVWVTTPIRQTDLNVTFSGKNFGTYPNNEQSNQAGLVTRELAKMWGDYCIDVNRMSSVVHLGEDPANFRMNRWAGQYRTIPNKFSNDQFISTESDGTWSVDLSDTQNIVSYEMFRNVAVEFTVDETTVFDPDFRLTLRKDPSNTGEMLFQFLESELKLIAYGTSFGMQATWPVSTSGKKFRIEVIGHEVKVYIDNVLTAPSTGSTKGYYQSMFLAPVKVMATSATSVRLTNFIVSGATRYDYNQHVPRLTPYQIFNVANGDGGNNLNHPNNLGEREMYSQPISEFSSYISGLNIDSASIPSTTELLTVAGSSGQVRVSKTMNIVTLSLEEFILSSNDGSSPVFILESAYTPQQTVTGFLLRTTTNDQTKGMQVRQSGDVYIALGGTGGVPWSGSVTYIV